MRRKTNWSKILKDHGFSSEEEAVTKTLKKYKRICHSAKALGISETTLKRKMAELGLDGNKQTRIQNLPPAGYFPPGYHDEYSVDKSPCAECELHLKGYDKGRVCEKCGKRIQYVMVSYDGIRTIGYEQPASSGSGFTEFNFSW